MNRVHVSAAVVTAAATTVHHHTRSTPATSKPQFELAAELTSEAAPPAADPHHRERSRPQHRSSGAGAADDYPLVDKSYARCRHGDALDCAYIQRAGRSGASRLSLASRISGAFPDGT